MDKPSPTPPPPPVGVFLNPVGVNVETPTVAGYDRNTQFVSLELASAKVEAVEVELKKQRAQHLKDLSTIDEKYKAAETKVRYSDCSPPPPQERPFATLLGTTPGQSCVR